MKDGAPTQSPAEKDPWLPNPVRSILQHEDNLDSCTWELNLSMGAAFTGRPFGESFLNRLLLL